MVVSPLSGRGSLKIVYKFGFNSIAPPFFPEVCNRFPNFGCTPNLPGVLHAGFFLRVWPGKVPQMILSWECSCIPLLAMQLSPEYLQGPETTCSLRQLFFSDTITN